MPGRPIPASAKFDDPIWTASFHQLANAMVECGAKPKLITRYTGLSSKAIVDRYKRLRDEEPPHGRMQHAQSKYYAIPNNRGGLAWTLQAAAFASICRKLEQAMCEPVNQGWLLTTAFQTYLRLTENQHEETRDQLNLSNAYDIKMYLSSHQRPGELDLMECDICGCTHLILTDVEIDSQGCPMCRLQRRMDMLAGNAEAIKAKRQAAIR